MLKRKLFGGKKKVAIAVLSAVLVVSLLLTAYQTISQTYIDSMILTLNYEGAKKGLNPDGSRFEISEIESDEVLKSAINIMGDTSLSVDDMRDRVNIESKMPRSAIEKTQAAIASGSDYSYNPSEFDVYYSQENKFGKNNTVEFLTALSRAYNEYFMNKYSDKNNVLEFDGEYHKGEYDYYEIQEYLGDKINSMISYLSARHSENPTFRSTQTGYSFENIINMLQNLRDQDLHKLNSYIVQNQIANDKVSFVNKQQYLADKQEEQYQVNMQSSNIAKNALLEYDPKITGVAFIPSVDQYNEYYMSRTKTGLDNIVVRSHNLGVTANEFKKNADEHRYIVGKFTEDIVAEGSNGGADEMIEELCMHLEKLSTIALKTDNEYVSQKTKNYITFNLPEKNFSIPVVAFVKNFLICLFVWYAIFRTAKLLKKRYDEKKETIKSKIKTVIEED